MCLCGFAIIRRVNFNEHSEITRRTEIRCNRLCQYLLYFCYFYNNCFFVKVILNLCMIVIYIALGFWRILKFEKNAWSLVTATKMIPKRIHFNLIKLHTLVLLHFQCLYTFLSISDNPECEQ